MGGVKLLPHQVEVLGQTEGQNKVAYYLDMGLGKTYVGSEKMVSLHNRLNLIICQKSKVDDWIEHLTENYGHKLVVYDLKNKKHMERFINDPMVFATGVINYELAFRRSELTKLKDFTLMLDESSLIQNENAQRSKFILNKLHPKNIILLSGTPTSGKYERLWSQMNLLGWGISKGMYYRQYVNYEYSEDGYPVISGYKNVDRLKRKMREHGCVFLKTEEVMDLPQQNFININVPESKLYKRFKKHGIIQTDEVEFVGDTTLTKLLYSRMLCGSHNEDKVKSFLDLVDSTEDRLIVFYNFNDEFNTLKSALATDRPYSIVNGQTKDLTAYEEHDNSITFIQYQAGAMGLNLQKANKIIYFTPTLSSELFEQSKKRIHRIGQDRPCFYYQLICGIEWRIYDTLAMRKDYTDELFREDFEK